MVDHQDFKFGYSVVWMPLIFVLLLWIVFWAEVKFGARFSDWGIYPRTTQGLRGILCSPFLHGDIKHLYHNSLPLLVLLPALRYFYREVSIYVLLGGILLSGFLTWAIGRPSYHIGASGLIYVLVSFIFFKGIYTRYYRLVALSLFVISVYGGLIWYVFPGIQQHISWEAHLAGFITGLLFSLLIKTEKFKKIPKYDWEKPDYNPSEDTFMRHFDENGNFIELPQQTTTSDFEVVYEFKEDKKEEL